MFFHLLGAFFFVIITAGFVGVACHIGKNRRNHDWIFAMLLFWLSTIPAAIAFMNFVRAVQIAYGH